MQINSAITSHSYYQSAGASHKVPGNPAGEFSNAITKCEKEEGAGEFLGLTMLPEEGKSVTYGMRAMLSDKSTLDRPIVQVITNKDGKTEVFEVDISKVDPSNASRMEMFALCCYEDKYGSGTGSTFGSFHTFRMYEETAIGNGCMKHTEDGIPVWEQFRNEKVNWVKICESVLDILQTIKDPKVMELFSKGKKLLNMYSRYELRE